MTSLPLLNFIREVNCDYYNISYTLLLIISFKDNIKHKQEYQYDYGNYLHEDLLLILFELNKKDYELLDYGVHMFDYY